MSATERDKSRKGTVPPSRQPSDVSVLGDLRFDQSKIYRRYVATDNANGGVDGGNGQDFTQSQSALSATSTDSLLPATAGTDSANPAPVSRSHRRLSQVQRGDDATNKSLTPAAATQPSQRQRSVTSGFFSSWLQQGASQPSINTANNTASAAQSRQPSTVLTVTPTRKRSSTATATSPTTAATTGTADDVFSSVIMQNTSIFKRRSDGTGAAETVTIVTRDVPLTEADLLPRSASAAAVVPAYSSGDGPMIPHLPVNRQHGRAHTTVGAFGAGGAVQRPGAWRLSADSMTAAGDDRRRHRPRTSSHYSAVVSVGGGRIKKSCAMVSATDMPPEGAPPHRREMSIATFLTAPDASGRLSRTSGGQWRRRRPPLSLAGLRVPRRWFSLRNVISFFNALILTAAVLVVVLVSYYAGVASTRSAISAMSNVTLTDITLKLDDVLGNGQLVNQFTEGALTGPSNTMNDTRSNVRLFYAFMSVGRDSTDQIFAVAPDSSYVGVSTYRDAAGHLIPGQLLVRYLNKTSRPNMLAYAVPAGCTTNQTVCYRQAFLASSTPLLNATYSVSNQPYYQLAMQRRRPGWGNVFLYNGGQSIGVTAFRPVWAADGSLMFLAAADIWLNSLSDYLSDMARLISGLETKATPSMFIFEPSGMMVASSNPTELPVLNPATAAAATGGGGGRQSVTDIRRAESDVVVRYLMGAFGRLDAIQWPDDGSPFVFEDADAHVIIGNYRRELGDIDWIVAAYVPFAAFNGRLVNAHFIQVPIVSVAVLILATLCSVAMTRAIGRPLKHIAEEMLRVADLNLDSDEDEDSDECDAEGFSAEKELQKAISTNSLASRMQLMCPTVSFSEYHAFDELKELQYLRSAMSAMKSGLKSFSKYVPLDVVTLLMKMKREAVLGVDEMELSIFFSDIVNFTTIAESVTPKQLVDIMCEYLSEMSDIILHSQGVVDKYIGDAVMAFWNAPLPVKEHANVACSVALKSQHRLAELRKAWLAQGYPEIKARIGISTGSALVGNLGSNTRLNYTCLGDNVNLASRLEGVNKMYGTEIIISEATNNQIHREYFVTRPLDVVAVKGKKNSSRVYELLGFRKLMSQAEISKYSMYERAFNELCEGNFLNAIEGFKTFMLAGHEDDIPAQKHLNFCRSQLRQTSRQPSAQQWTYQVLLDEK